MGLKNFVNNAGEKAANKISKLSTLSKQQLEEVEKYKNEYLNQKPDPTDPNAVELTNRLLAASGIEIYNAYLPQLSDLYTPLKSDSEYVNNFDANFNVRYFNITKWVADKKENNIEKLVNVYEVLSNEECNIALIFNRKQDTTKVYLAVTDTLNSKNSVNVINYKKRLKSAISGNFPGSELVDGEGSIPPCFNDGLDYSIASATNIPTEKSKKFISQTIEKLIDGCVPDDVEDEYTLILLATPILNVEERKLRLSEIYSGLAPYASWQTSYQYNENNSVNSSATVGVNVGASAGIQQGVNNSLSEQSSKQTSENEQSSSSESNSIANSESNSHSTSESKGSSENYQTSSGRSTSHTEGSSDAAGGTVDIGIFNGNYNHTWSDSDTFGDSYSESISKGITDSTSSTSGKTIGETVSNSVSKTLSSTLGKAFSKGLTTTKGIFKGTNLGLNFGANFARSSSVTATIGKSESIVQTYNNYSIKHALELLENQMKRYDKSSALGMWDFAAYVISEDFNIANNVAHSYVALTQGEESFMSKSAINLWRGDLGEESAYAKEIYNYLKNLRHPIFGLNPSILVQDGTYFVYPAAVTATTALTGKELAYSLNFPQKSIPGLPVIQCAEFGRNVVTYDDYEVKDNLNIGNIYHMHHLENSKVQISKQSLASHAFVTGSTGSGKSNTTYQIIDEALKQDINFLVVEPAKGEYKNVFGNREDVNIYGTNPELAPLLKINPFSFPKGIHVLEHLDRLVEIFNVCWPMYAAMPAVLKNAIEKSYQDCGWDLNLSVNRYKELIYPTFKDVSNNIRSIIDSSEYDTENKGAYKGSLLTRLESLTNGLNGMIFVNDEISSDVLFNQNTIIDLSRVGSTETKSMIMGMIILKLQEYRMSSSEGINLALKHLTVLEEAHNLLKRTSTEQSSEGSNLIGKSVEMLANSIAEMRTYGEGFVIVDQSPGLLDMSVIRNTNTKIIMRLPDKSDRELVGKAANLNDDQIVELAKLPKGVAAVYQNEWIQPVLCKVERFNYDETLYKYEHDLNDNAQLNAKKANFKNLLLNKIIKIQMNDVNDKEEFKSFRNDVIDSNLDAKVKIDYLDYIGSNSDVESLKHLSSLVFDLMDAEKIINQVDSDNIKDFVDILISKIKPSIIETNQEESERIVGLLLREKAIRDINYRNVFMAFNEIWNNEGDVK